MPQDEKSGGAGTWLSQDEPVLGTELLKTLGRRKAGRDGSERRKLEAFLACRQTSPGLSISGACAAARAAQAAPRLVSS